MNKPWDYISIEDMPFKENPDGTKTYLDAQGNPINRKLQILNQVRETNKMKQLTEKLDLVAFRVQALEEAIAKWKENTGTVVQVVEVVKEVPVEVIREVEKLIEPDTTALEAKLDALGAGLGSATDVISSLTSVAPVVDKAVEVVSEAIIAANEAPDPTPATDAFVATEPAITEPAPVVEVVPAEVPTE